MMPARGGNADAGQDRSALLPLNIGHQRADKSKPTEAKNMVPFAENCVRLICHPTVTGANHTMLAQLRNG